MANLKEKSITLLATFTGQITGSPTLFTTVAGRKTRITHVVFRNPASTVAAATNMSITNFVQNFSVAALTSTTGYVVIGPIHQITTTTPAQYTEIAAATAVVLTTTTGAAVSTTVDVFGYTST